MKPTNGPVSMTHPSQLEDVKDPKHPRWAEFYRKYTLYLAFVARQQGLPEEKIEDMVASVMSELSTRVMPKFDYDPAKGKFRSFLKTIIRRRIISQIDKDHREPLLVHPPKDAEETDEPFIDQQPDEASKTAAEQALTDLAREVVSTAMRILRGPEHKFSEAQLQAFELYVIKDIKVTDVCERLGLDEQQVYNAKHRIMEAFGDACK